MAIFHMNVNKVSRSSGRSSTAAAAYRAACVLYDVRTGRTHNFTNKRGVLHTAIFAPAGADWAHDREVLWNSVEASERRKDAATAREWRVALPVELSAEKRIELAEKLAQKLVSEFGVAVDLAIHEPDDKHQDEDLLNYHCHLLTTTRIALPEGLGDKTRDLDRLNTSGPLVESMREWWARTCNAFLEDAGSDARVDHRTLEAQRTEALTAGDLEAAAALDRTPTEHKGPTRTYAHTDERAAEVVEERAEQAEQASVMLVRAQEAAERAAALLGALEASEVTLRASQRQAEPSKSATKPFRFEKRDRSEPQPSYAEYVEGPAPSWATAAEVAEHERLMDQLAAERQRVVEAWEETRRKEWSDALKASRAVWAAGLVERKAELATGVIDVARSAMNWLRDRLADAAKRFGWDHWWPRDMRNDLYEVVADHSEVIEAVIADNHARAEKTAKQDAQISRSFDM